MLKYLKTKCLDIFKSFARQVPLFSAIFTLLIYLFYSYIATINLEIISPKWLIGTILYDSFCIFFFCQIGNKTIRRAFTIVLLFSLYVLIFSHILYIRAFGSYFDITLMSEFRNLSGLSNSIFGLINAFDVCISLLYLTLCVISLHLIDTFDITTLLLNIVICILLAIFPFAYVHKMDQCPWMQTKSVLDQHYLMQRDFYAYRFGIVNLMYKDIANRQPSRIISDDDISLINGIKRDNLYQNTKSWKNCILIIVESLSTDALFRVCNGDTVMPNIQRLMSNGVCFTNIESMICGGQSADGQFIIMTGLLPHHRKVITQSFSHNEFPGLPKLFKENKLETAMIVPTQSYFWRQNEMAEVYGIDNLYGFDEWVTDSVVVDKTIQYCNEKAETPFFLTLLTISMHGAYDDQSETISKYKSEEYSEKYANYLSKCHYTDSQLGRLFEMLKNMGIWDETLIFITSDHMPQSGHLDDTLEDKMPLLLINIGLDLMIDNTRYGQQDIYPTLLDILNFENKDYQGWRGVGYSMFNTDSITLKQIDLQKKVSEIILETNYFSNKGE